MSRAPRDRLAVAGVAALGAVGAWALTRPTAAPPVSFFRTKKQDGVDQGLGGLGTLPCGVERTAEPGDSFADEYAAQFKAYVERYGVTAGERGRSVPAWPRDCALAVGRHWRDAWVRAALANPERFSLVEPWGGETYTRLRHAWGATIAPLFGLEGYARRVNDELDEWSASSATEHYREHGAPPEGWQLSRLGAAIVALDDAYAAIEAANEAEVYVLLQGQLAKALRQLAIALDVRGFSVPIFDALDQEADQEIRDRFLNLPKDTLGALWTATLATLVAGAKALLAYPLLIAAAVVAIVLWRRA